MNIKRTILVIDSDPEPARRIENILRTEGYTISSASTPEQILSVLKEMNPSLIFASLSMPDGLEICRRIHSMTAFSKIPIIALVPEKGKVRYEEEYGIVDSLNRAFSADELILKTETVLSIKEITEIGPKAERTQYRPPEERIETLPVENEIKAESPLKEDLMPVHEEVEGLIEKSFEPETETLSKEDYPVGKKKRFLIPILILSVLIISVAVYFVWQNIGAEIRSLPIINKILPSKTVPTAKPAPPLQPPKASRPLVTGQEPTSKTPIETKAEVKPESEKAVSKTPVVRERPFFSAQVGAYKDRGNAEAFVERLKDKGYDAFIKDITKGNERFHKVLVGKFEDRKKADEMVSTLKAKENIKAIIYISE